MEVKVPKEIRDYQESIFLDFPPGSLSVPCLQSA